MNTEDLDSIGKRNLCDKFTSHNFEPIYEKYFIELRDQKLKMLEIGIGGESYEDGGASLKTWQ
jgi:hypothetical protein